MERLVKNKIRCNKCGDEIESTYTHDFKFCKCGAIAVDGGLDYIRRVGDLDSYTELSEYEIETESKGIMEEKDYDKETGLPHDKSYLECGLPPYVQDSLEAMKKSWAIIDNGGKDIRWDCYWCELNADLNSAEIEGLITSEQAWYLREKYLRMERRSDIL